jgi:hypothetical protein
MNVGRTKLVPGLFALTGVLFLVPTAASVSKGEPLNVTFPVLSMAFFILAFIFLVAGRRKSGENSRP